MHDEDDIVQELKEENVETDEETKDQFNMPILNDGLNVVNLFRKIVLDI